MAKFFVFSSKLFLIGLLAIVSAFTAAAQTDGKTETASSTPRPTPVAKRSPKALTVEQVVETAIFIYNNGRNVDQIRKTTLERGRTTVTAGDGRPEQSNYQRFVLRGETLVKERIRLDQEIASTRFSLLYNDQKVVGIFNNTVFTPREDAVKGFENQIFRSLDAFLRYKANESKIELALHEKLMGVDYYVVDITDKQDRKTRFYVSAKSYRIMMLSYEDAGVKYRRKFYNYKYAQNTLVPYRTVLWADEKQVEETEVGTITFGQKVDEELFKAG